MDLYIHSPIRLHGVVLNQLSTGVILPFTLLYTSEDRILQNVYASRFPHVCPHWICIKDSFRGFRAEIYEFT
jgi:hypothetical protein